MSLLYVLLLGIANRIRGGLFNLPSTQLGRLVFASTFGLIAAHPSLEPMYFVHAGSLTVLMFLSLVNGWGIFCELDPITELTNRSISLHDLAGFMLRGIELVALPIVYIMFVLHENRIGAQLFLVGLSIPLPYYISSFIPKRDFLGKPLGEWIGGEFIYGLMFGAALI